MRHHTSRPAAPPWGEGRVRQTAILPSHRSRWKSQRPAGTQLRHVHGGRVGGRGRRTSDATTPLPDPGICRNHGGQPGDHVLHQSRELGRARHVNRLWGQRTAGLRDCPSRAGGTGSRHCGSRAVAAIDQDRRRASRRASRSASSRHASASAASTVGSSPAILAARRSETARPRFRKIERTISARPSARPSARASRRCAPSQGSSSGPVPAAAPSARPTRSSTARGRLRQRRLVQGRVNLGRRPARQGDARRHRPIAVRIPTVNGQARPAPGRAALRHLDPHLGKAPRLVQAQLAAAHVGGVVHLEHHVRQVVRPHLDGGAPRPRLHRVEPDHLVRLHDALPLAPRVAQQQVRRAEGQDGRPPDRRDARQQPDELLAGARVIDGRRLARHPGRLGRGVPVLEAALVVVDGGAGDAHGTAARELGRVFGEVGPGGARRRSGGRRRGGGIPRRGGAGSHCANVPRTRAWPRWPAQGSSSGRLLPRAPLAVETAARPPSISRRRRSNRSDRAQAASTGLPVGEGRVRQSTILLSHRSRWKNQCRAGARRTVSKARSRNRNPLALMRLGNAGRRSDRA